MPVDPAACAASASPQLAALIDAAWAAQFDDPTRIAEHAQDILAGARPGSIEAAWGHLHLCWAARFANQRAQAAQALAEAERLFTALDDARGLASVADIRLRETLREGHDLPGAAPLDDSQRGPWESLVSHYGHFAAGERFSRPDDALRALYRALAAARRTGHAGALANTLSMLGAKHADVGDLEPARQLCQEALEQAKPSRPGPNWQIAALNLLFVAIEQGDAATAAALADEVQSVWAQLLPHTLEQSTIYIARSRLLKGQVGAARQGLDGSTTAHSTRLFIGEWTAAHLACCLAEGQAQKALVDGQAWLDSGGEQAQFTTPTQVLQVHRAMAEAAQALNRFELALEHERAAQRSYETQMGRAARTRRITLEIEHELARERWQREQAQARQEEAEAEGRRLAQLNHALEVATETRTRFLAAASHDLRQPVHALALQVAALRAHLNAPVQHEMAARIDRCVGALSHMFDGLLDLSRMDAGVVAPDITPLALAPLLARLVEEQAPMAERKGLRLALRVPRHGSPQATTHSDAELLSRALRNLIVNALKFTQSGGVLLSLRARGERWWVEVWDTGIGIAEAERERVFDEFYQVGNTARQRDQGLGLGLAIVQRLLLLLGHPLRLHSSSGRGTRFVLELPCSPAQLTEAAPTAAAPSPLGLRVWVVEDDADVRAALRDLLMQWGCEVSEGDSAAAVMRMAAQAPPPQAVLADLRLPDGRNGIGEVALLRQRYGAALPALMVTGDTAPQPLRELAASGLPWLSKPVQVGDVLHWLRAVARRQENETRPAAPATSSSA